LSRTAACYLCRIPYKLDYGDELIGEYLNFIMNSPEAKKFCNSVKTDGVNQSSISAKKSASL
ncbi:MAG: hypothetical protein PUG16_06730, partial [Lachnospiraceae bacterium]|nr:hypothetical protein [Lachnospiraceae bacterium]